MNTTETIRTISFHKLQDRIMELLFRAQTFSKWSHELYKLYDPTSDSSRNLFIAMHVNLYFAEALICTHTLLFGNTEDKKEEISIGYLNSKYKNKLNELPPDENSFGDIRDEYVRMHLHNIRHKFFAHKDIVDLGDPVTGFLNRIEERHISNLENILTRIEKLLYQTLPDPVANNYFISFYQPAFDYLKAQIMKNEA
jgi:hypothetical protein